MYNEWEICEGMNLLFIFYIISLVKRGKYEKKED